MACKDGSCSKMFRYSKILCNNLIRRGSLRLHPIPMVDSILTQLSGASVITNLDANRGFWKIPLAKDSHMQITFVTRFSRYITLIKLPSGISSAQSYFNMPNKPDHRGSRSILRLMNDVLVCWRQSRRP